MTYISCIQYTSSNRYGLRLLTDRLWLLQYIRNMNNECQVLLNIMQHKSLCITALATLSQIPDTEKRRLHAHLIVDSPSNDTDE